MKKLMLLYWLLVSLAASAQVVPTISDLPKPIAVKVYRGNGVTLTFNLSGASPVVTARAKLGPNGALLPSSQQPVVTSGAGAASLAWSSSVTAGMPNSVYVEVLFNGATKIVLNMALTRDTAPGGSASTTVTVVLTDPGSGIPIDVTMLGAGGNLPVVDAYTKEETDNLLSGKANLANIPTNNLQLTNGAGYVTASGVLSTSLSGLSTTITQGVSATHTVLQGIGLLQGQINSLTANVASVSATNGTQTTGIVSLSTSLTSFSAAQGTLNNSLTANIASLSATSTTLVSAVASLQTTWVYRELPSGSVNGSNVSFTLANVPITGSEHVYLNGLLMESGSGNDYTISGAVITFSAAPLTGEKLRVTYRK